MRVRVRARARARLRRDGGHGLDRPGDSRGGRAAGTVRAARAADRLDPRSDAPAHPARVGVGSMGEGRPVHRARAGCRRGRRGAAPAVSVAEGVCGGLRRGGGRARAGQRDRAVRREHVPVASPAPVGARAGGRSLSAALGPGPAAVCARHPRPVAYRNRGLGRARHGRRPGRAAPAHSSRRRSGLGPGRASGPGAR